MLDDLVIIVTTVMCLFICFRAIRLDGQMPWFGTRAEAPPEPKPRKDEWGDLDLVP